MSIYSAFGQAWLASPSVPRLNEKCFVDYAIVFAQVAERHAKAMVEVRRLEDSSLVAGPVEIPLDTVLDYLDPDHDQPAASAEKRKAQYFQALAKAGLPKIGDDSGLYEDIYFQGTATLKVMESFSEQWKPGDRISVSWRTLYRHTARGSEPPFKGEKTVFAVSRKAAQAGTFDYIHHYVESLDEVRKLHAASKGPPSHNENPSSGEQSADGNRPSAGQSPDKR
jgi:hypothetical protein